MNGTILIICNNKNILTSLKYILANRGYSFLCEPNIERVIYKLNVIEYYAIIIHANKEILYNISKIRLVSDIPIFVLYDKRDSELIYDCFECGIDDYFISPYPYTEISYKIGRTINRVSKEVPKTLLYFKSLKIDYNNKTAMIDENVLKLSRVEFEILYYLLVNRNIYLSRRRIYQTIWKSPYYDGDRCIDIHICLLRKKLLKYSKNIVSKRSYGYAFKTS